MHDTAFRIGTLAMTHYSDVAKASILEIGAQSVNGSLRSSALPTTQYTGVDIEQGEGVDLVVEPGQPLPLDDDQFDLVMASSVFEHDSAFWRTFLEMCRKAKPGGFIYVSAPSNGKVHRYPQDYWRFYPDASLALKRVAEHEGVDVALVESFIAEREHDEWNDFCAVFRRGPSKKPLPTNFIYQQIAATNVLTWESSEVINEREQTEDQVLYRRERDNVHHLVRVNRAEREARETEREFLARSAAEGLVARERANLLTEEASAKSQEAERQVAQITEQLSARERQIADLETNLNQRHEEISEAWRQLEAERMARDALAKEVEQQKTEVGKLIGRLESADKAQAELAERLRGAEEQSAQLEFLLKNKNRDLTWLQKVSEIAGVDSPSWRRFMPPEWRRRRQLRILRDRGLFDSERYVQRFPDVSEANVDPLLHYVMHGMNEGRQIGIDLE